MVAVVSMETVVEGGDSGEDGGGSDEDNDGDDTRCSSSLSMGQASECRTLTTSFPPHTHSKVVLFMLMSYFRDGETGPEEGIWLSPSQPGGGRAGLVPGLSDHHPQEQIGTGSGERGSFQRAASGPRGTEVGQRGAHTEGGL